MVFLFSMSKQQGKVRIELAVLGILLNQTDLTSYILPLCSVQINAQWHKIGTALVNKQVHSSYNRSKKILVHSVTKANINKIIRYKIWMLL